MKVFNSVTIIISTLFLWNSGYCLPKPVDEICCAGAPLMRYTDAPPFDHLPLPVCGEDLNIHINLYTHSNRDVGVPVTRNNIPPEFDNSRLTIFYTHGYLGSDNNNWLEKMKDDSLIRGDYNVIVVGWQDGSQQIWYPRAASDTRSVGMEIGLVAENLVKNGLDRSLLYCVGHSLGGHVCGHAGNYFKFGRITGMDPAGPLFEKSDDLTIGLNPNSADLVDNLHTNGEKHFIMNLGTMKRLGHIDFYPNGGGRQPECRLDPLAAEAMDLLPACSHMRAVQYFEVSILSPCFRSNQKCLDQYSLPTSCATSPNTIQVMGFDSNQYPEQGIFYLETTGDKPFCLGR